MENEQFVISYLLELETGLSCEAHLTVSKKNMEVSGVGRTTHVLNPSNEAIISHFYGNYHFVIEREAGHEIRIALQGFPNFNWPAPSNKKDFMRTPNFKLELLLDRNWEIGTANISYRDSSGTWVETNEAELVRIDEMETQETA